MIKIEVTGNSIPEVADKLLSIGASLRGHIEVNAVREAPQVDRNAAEVEVAEAAPVNPTPEEPASSGQTEASAPPTEEKSSASADLDYNRDVRSVALKVVEKCGKPVMQEILLRFGVTNASFLPPEQFPELISAMNAALAR